MLESLAPFLAIPPGLPFPILTPHCHIDVTIDHLDALYDGPSAGIWARTKTTVKVRPGECLPAALLFVVEFGGLAWNAMRDPADAIDRIMGADNIHVHSPFPQKIRPSNPQRVVAATQNEQSRTWDLEFSAPHFIEADVVEVRRTDKQGFPLPSVWEYVPKKDRKELFPIYIRFTVWGVTTGVETVWNRDRARINSIPYSPERLAQLEKRWAHRGAVPEREMKDFLEKQAQNAPYWEEMDRKAR